MPNLPTGPVPYLVLAILIVGAVCAWLFWIDAYAEIGRWWAARRLYAASQSTGEPTAPLPPSTDWLWPEPSDVTGRGQ